MLSQAYTGDTTAATHLPHFELALPAHEQREEQRNAAWVENAHEDASCSRASDLSIASLRDMRKHTPDA